MENYNAAGDMKMPTEGTGEARSVSHPRDPGAEHAHEGEADDPEEDIPGAEPGRIGHPG